MSGAFGPEICGDFESATAREWLETNGRGGFAASTLGLCHTRRYHGLLIAATAPPLGRQVLLSKLDLVIRTGNAVYHLGTNRCVGGVDPHGYRNIDSFCTDPWPTWEFRVEGVHLRQEVLMLDGRNAVVVRASLLEAPGPIRLEACPLVTSRRFHDLTRRADLPHPTVATASGELKIVWSDGRTGTRITHDGRFYEDPGWHCEFDYVHEARRGYDHVEDLFRPGFIHWELEPGESAMVVASDPSTDVECDDRLVESERRRREALKYPDHNRDPRVGTLARAATQFLVRDDRDRWDVIAGYPWFGTWSRDALISLPGLTLATGRTELARSVLNTYADRVSEGMIPNCLSEVGAQPSYNAADSSLWFIWALGRCRGYCPEAFANADWFPTVRRILERYERGARFGIHLDQDGLLFAGEPGLQLTWMDACVEGTPVTPRTGKPVELQALWYRGLVVGRTLAGALRETSLANHYQTLMRQAETAFEDTFWNADANCCYDSIDPHGIPDPAIRPNQVFVVALSPGLLSENRRRRLIETVAHELLTPMGLRTLSPRDSAYQGRYHGDIRARDNAYHQGTVWPWLMGSFVSAYLAVHGQSRESREQAETMLGPLLKHLDEAGVGQLSEVADGDTPQSPGGCIAQAWSVAEVLRAVLEHGLFVSGR